MADINGTIKFEKSEYRPCLVEDKISLTTKKALFHRFETKEIPFIKFTKVMSKECCDKIALDYETKKFLPPYCELEKIKSDFAIVEYEDGTVDEVDPKRVKFIDNKIKDYDFNDNI